MKYKASRIVVSTLLRQINTKLIRYKTWQQKKEIVCNPIWEEKVQEFNQQ
ncbi:MAG: hypothetical protein ACI8W3_001087 [Myxococcota bacterium]|jgi:hypothetical protein